MGSASGQTMDIRRQEPDVSEETETNFFDNGFTSDFTRNGANVTSNRMLIRNEICDSLSVLAHRTTVRLLDTRSL